MESDKKKIGTADSIRKISALLIDDEIGAINTLRGMLKEYCPQIQIVGTAFSVNEAIHAAANLQPELVFLDIEMPPVGSGFDFLRQCGEIHFGVIFATAYPQYAIRAINTIQPWAYLVKPYSVTELKTAVQVSVEKIQQMDQSLLQVAGRQTILLNDSRKGTIVLRAGDIIYCQARGSFTDIFVWKNHKVEKITSSRNLGEFEDELPRTLFCRTHHGYLVNLAYVERLERTGRNGIIHLRHTPVQVDVSVSKLEIFTSHLEEFCLANTIIE